MVLGGTAIRPKERHGWDKIKYLLYNNDTGEVLTRTPKSWLLIFIFYCIYYSCLAAFWAAMLLVFFQTIDYNQPKWTGDNGIIGISPGLGMRPTQAEKNIDSSIVGIDPQNEFGGDLYEGYGDWSARADEFLEKYRNKSEILKACTADDPSNANTACEFDFTTLGPCGQPPYGYKDGKPCIFLKLNKIFGVQNEPYNDTNALPEEMPDDLKKHIGAQGNKNQVWVNCRPEYPADLEGVVDISYFPESRGFPNYFFPYLKQEEYESPIIAVQFETKRPGQLIHIECRAWGKNIGYSRRDRLGIVHFEIIRSS